MADAEALFRDVQEYNQPAPLTLVHLFELILRRGETMPNMYLPFLAGALIGGIVGLVLSSSSISEIIRLRRTRAVPISTLPSEGQAEIVGTAHGEITDSLLTDTPSVLCQVSIERQTRQSRQESSWWQKIYNNLSYENLELADSTGRIRIIPERAALELRDKLDTIKLSQERLLDRLRSLDIDGTLASEAGGQLRAHEWIVQDGEEIHVFGDIKLDSGMKKMIEARIISDRPEQRLLGSLYRRVLWRVIGGILLGPILVWALLYMGVL